jgi:hypothetical protein
MTNRKRVPNLFLLSIAEFRESSVCKCACQGVRAPHKSPQKTERHSCVQATASPIAGRTVDSQLVLSIDASVTGGSEEWRFWSRVGYSFREDSHVEGGFRNPLEMPSAAPGSMPLNSSTLVNMLDFRYDGADAAQRVYADTQKRSRSQPCVYRYRASQDRQGRAVSRRQPITGCAMSWSDVVSWGSSASTWASLGLPAVVVSSGSRRVSWSPVWPVPSSDSSPVPSMACGQDEASRLADSAALYICSNPTRRWSLLSQKQR